MNWRWQAMSEQFSFLPQTRWAELATMIFVEGESAAAGRVVEKKYA